MSDRYEDFSYGGISNRDMGIPGIDRWRGYDREVDYLRAKQQWLEQQEEDDKRYWESRSSHSSSPHDDAMALYMKGCELSKLGRHEEALQAFNQALRLQPNDTDALSRKGETLSKLERHEEALQAFNQVLRLQPNDEYILFREGITLSRLGRYEEALQAYNQALRLRPNDAGTLKLLKQVHKKLGRL